MILGVGVVATTSLAGATSSKDQEATGHAVFVEIDQAANSVFSSTRGTDGTTSYVATYSTEGAGASAADAAADPLASQGDPALVDGGHELIATNPGSNTVSLFRVRGPFLKLIQRVSSGGQFPDSIGVQDNLIAVLNAGGAGSVSEFQLHHDHLVSLNSETRTLGLTNTNALEFHHGAGQISYSPNGKILVVTTKLSTNAYDVFTVGDDGTLSASPTVTGSTNALPFSFTFDANGNLVGAQASNSSVSTYSFNANGSLTPIGTLPDRQAALRWVASAQGHFFGENSGSATVSSFGELASGAPTLLNATATAAHAGTIDAAASPDGQFPYVESGGAGALDAYAVSSTGVLKPIGTCSTSPSRTKALPSVRSLTTTTPRPTWPGRFCVRSSGCIERTSGGGSGI